MYRELLAIGASFIRYLSSWSNQSLSLGNLELMSTLHRIHLSTINLHYRQSVWKTSKLLMPLCFHFSPNTLYMGHTFLAAVAIDWLSFSEPLSGFLRGPLTTQTFSSLGLEPLTFNFVSAGTRTPDFAKEGFYTVVALLIWLLIDLYAL